jgi:hypothetical protein
MPIHTQKNETELTFWSRMHEREERAAKGKEGAVQTTAMMSFFKGPVLANLGRHDSG